MKSAKVYINNLRVRAPGLGPDQARRLGELVAQGLADARLEGQTSRNISSARVQLRSSSGRSLDVVANEIVAGIRNELR